MSCVVEHDRSRCKSPVCLNFIWFFLCVMALYCDTCDMASPFSDRKPRSRHIRSQQKKIDALSLSSAE